MLEKSVERSAVWLNGLLTKWRDAQHEIKMPGDKASRLRLEHFGADFERYLEEKRKHSIYKSGAGVWAERLFLEGMDPMGGAGKPIAWLGDETIVAPYKTCDFDDRMKGADALLLIFDEEDERQAYPIAIDLTTNPEEIKNKISRDLAHLLPNAKQVYSHVHWY
ncbi:MAG TPA: hypothetical protein VFQ60_02775, partial [Patescibacteria group bacterium]|nr:hypothetical protein [Patescibacteria group bacterium]